MGVLRSVLLDAPHFATYSPLIWYIDSSEQLPGLATRIAFNLGLHLDCGRWRKASHISEEAIELRLKKL